MRWTRLTPIGGKKCATATCLNSARWHAESGGVGSDYCAECREMIDGAILLDAAREVVEFDWSDNDPDAVAAIDRLRTIVRDR